MPGQPELEYVPSALVEKLKALLSEVYGEGYSAPEENPLLPLAREYGVPTVNWAVNKAEPRFDGDKEFASEEAAQAAIAVYNRGNRILSDWRSQLYKSK